MVLRCKLKSLFVVSLRERSYLTLHVALSPPRVSLQSNGDRAMLLCFLGVMSGFVLARFTARKRVTLSSREDFLRHPGVIGA